MNATAKCEECEDVKKHKPPQNAIAVLFSASENEANCF